jgi:DNA helicase II / ATP-dependent DNA helicase PcrA
MRGLTLNPEQRAAVEHGGGPLLVLAGAGSGKTRVLTARVARLVAEDDVPPRRILAVTFTNKAAGVMRDRIADLLGSEPRGIWIGTFHSICARLLRREGDRLPRGSHFTIYDEDDSLRALKRAMEEAGLDTGRWSPAALRARISDAKNALVGPDEYGASAFDLMSRTVADVYPTYEKILVRSRAYDFDDLLVHAVRLLEDHADVGSRYAERFLHVLVDEYQDTNHAQYRIVRRLAGGHGNVCVVGDDDQSIYGWRGADLRNILDFERDFPGAAVVRLEENYRSTPSILEVANAVIERNRARKEKRLRTARPDGEPVAAVRLPDERAEASWVVEEILRAADGRRFGDCVILYRTNAQSRPFEDALRRARVPYRIVGSVRFYERREIKDVLAYLQLAVNPADEAAFARAVSWPRRGVGSVTLERLREFAAERGIPLLAAAERSDEGFGLPPAGVSALRDFAAGISALSELARDSSVEETIRECIRSFGVVEALESEEDGADRIANVTELLAAAASFSREEAEDAAAEATDLEAWLQGAALRADLDDYDESAPGVTLMTLHNAKGLEYPVVFVAGLEDGLFPLSRSMETEEELEEERRLFYVGVTRAQDRLYLTHADRRWRYGSETRSAPSQFLDEIPEESVLRRWGGAGEPRGGAGRLRAAGAGRSRPGGSGTGAVRPDARDGLGGRSAALADEEDAGDWSWRRPPRRSGRGLPEPPGPRYDWSDSQEPLLVVPGARVVHPEFGEGEIVAVSGSGTSTKAEIEFGAAGRRKVMVAHAGLRPA